MKLTVNVYAEQISISIVTLFKFLVWLDGFAEVNNEYIRKFFFFYLHKAKINNLVIHIVNNLI